MSLTIKLPENVYRYPYEFVGVAAYSAAAFAAASLPMPGMAQLIAIPAFAGLASLRAKGGPILPRISCVELPFARICFLICSCDTVHRPRICLIT